VRNETEQQVWRWARGQGLVEYALIFALIVLAVVGTLILFGPQIASVYKNIENAI
jgi:Flp pilus assembly pilin Flp